jgi:hypothetical protein
MALLDMQTGIELMEIVSEEVRRLHARQLEGALTGGDHQGMERLAKTFHILQAEIRDSEKGMGKLSEADLSALADNRDDGADSTS